MTIPGPVLKIISVLVFLTLIHCNNKNLNRQSVKDRSLNHLPNPELVLSLAPSENNPRNSEGDFITLKNGRILFIYSHFYGNTPSDFAPGYLAQRYSDDGGKSWSNQDKLVVENDAQMSVRSVSLLRLGNGSIGLFYMRQNTDSDNIPHMRISKDEAKTWSEATPCITDKKGYFVLNNDRVIQLKSGRLIVPVSLHKTPETKWSANGRIWTYYSDDNGNSWKYGKEVENPENVLLQEPGVVELKEGRILMFMRTDEGVQYQSFSNDKGESWTAAKPGNIPSPRSPVSIERIPSTGDLLLVWNNNDGSNQAIAKKRTPLNTAVSRDEGKTWDNTRTLENDPAGWFCYTAIHFESDSLLLGYCAGNKQEGTGLSVTHITRLPTMWLYSKDSVVE